MTMSRRRLAAGKPRMGEVVVTTWSSRPARPPRRARWRTGPAGETSEAIGQQPRPQVTPTGAAGPHRRRTQRVAAAVVHDSVGLVALPRPDRRHARRLEDVGSKSWPQDAAASSNPARSAQPTAQANPPSPDSGTPRMATRVAGVRLRRARRPADRAAANAPRDRGGLSGRHDQRCGAFRATLGRRTRWPARPWGRGGTARGAGQAWAAVHPACWIERHPGSLTLCLRLAEGPRDDAWSPLPRRLLTSQSSGSSWRW